MNSINDSNLKAMDESNVLAAAMVQIDEFCRARDWDQFHEVKDLAIGLVTEGSELLEIFRFRSREECEALFQDVKKREEVEDEMADVFFFLLRISSRYQVDLLQALERKMKKNAAKYPVEKSRGSNRKYDEL